MKEPPDKIRLLSIEKGVKSLVVEEIDMTVGNKNYDINNMTIKEKDLTVERSIPSIYPSFVKNKNISEKEVENEITNPSCE